MSKFSDAKTYLDLLHLFDGIGEILNSSRAKLPYPDIDARHVAIRGMQEIVGGYAMGFSSMIHSRTQDQIIESFGKSNLTPDEQRQIVENAWKNGLLVLFHFKLDSLFQNLLRALGTYDRKKQSFANITEQLINTSKLANPVTPRHTLLLCTSGEHRQPAR